MIARDDWATQRGGDASPCAAAAAAKARPRPRRRRIHLLRHRHLVTWTSLERALLASRGGV
jgi:hypothetical protein